MGGAHGAFLVSVRKIQEQLELLQLLIHFNSRVAPLLLHLIHHIHLCLGPIFSQQDPPPMWRLGADDGSCTNHCDGLSESAIFSWGIPQIHWIVVFQSSNGDFPSNCHFDPFWMSQVTGRRVASSMDWANMCGNPLRLHTSHVDAYIIDQFQEKINATLILMFAGMRTNWIK